MANAVPIETSRSTPGLVTANTGKYQMYMLYERRPRQRSGFVPRIRPTRAFGWTADAIRDAVASATSSNPGRYVNGDRSSNRMNAHTSNAAEETVAASSSQAGSAWRLFHDVNANGRHTTASAEPISSADARVSVP